MTTFFTSDTHFNHANVIKYCKRPFETVEEMNEALIANWNSVVKPGDTVWHLGDFAMGQKIHHQGFFDRLNGIKMLVRGNHDQSEEKMLAMGWKHAKLTTLLLQDDNRVVWATHIPPKALDPYEDRTYPSAFGAYLDHPDETTPFHDIQLCGHVHDAWKRRGNVINVGVDVWGFKPVTLKQLLTAVPEEAPVVPREEGKDGTPSDG